MLQKPKCRSRVSLGGQASDKLPDKTSVRYRTAPVSNSLSLAINNRNSQELFISDSTNSSIEHCRFNWNNGNPWDVWPVAQLIILTRRHGVKPQGSGGAKSTLKSFRFRIPIIIEQCENTEQWFCSCLQMLSIFWKLHFNGMQIKVSSAVANDFNQRQQRP